MRGAALALALLATGPATAGADDPAPGLVSQISDPRVVEASGMALSTEQPGLAYVVNDSGNAPVVFTVRVATGEVVGTTTLTGVQPEDVEALAVDADGRLLVADIGDNSGSRTEVALLELPQPGTGSSSLTPAVHRVRYAGGPADAEALVAHPKTGRLAIITKDPFGGQVLTLPAFVRSGVTVARPQDVQAPGLVTDASVLPARGGVVLRSYGSAYVYTFPGWRLVGRRDLPSTEQGETIAAEPGGRTVLVGSEGSPSPLIRVRLPEPALAALRRDADLPGLGPVDTDSAPPPRTEYGRYLYPAAGAVLVGLLGGTAWARRRTRHHS